MSDEFEEYTLANTQAILEAKKVITDPIGDNPNLLPEKMEEAASWASTVSSMVPFAEGFLDGARAEAFDLISENVTSKGNLREREIRIKIEAAVGQEKRFLGAVKRYTEDLDRRWRSCQSMLSMAKRERQMSGR